MCELRRKLLAFDYVIGRLVEWDRKASGRSEEKSLKMFSNIRLMKCLYSICATSVAFYDKKDKSLFNLFDNFIAYPRGPVEVDAYGNLSSLIRYTMYYDPQEEDSYLIPNKKFKDEFEITYRGLEKDLFEKDTTQALMNLIQTETKLTEMMPLIDDAIKLLKGATNFPNFEDRETLISITHLELWEEACKREDKKLDTENILKIKNEFKLLKEKIGLVA